MEILFVDWLGSLKELIDEVLIIIVSCALVWTLWSPFRQPLGGDIITFLIAEEA